MFIDTCILLCAGVVAATGTFLVSERLRQGPVRASAGLSLLVAGLFYFFPHSLDPYLVKNIPIIFIGASFIGMVSARLHPGYLRLAVAGIIFCTLYLNTSRFFTGYGGALGTAASISLLAILSLPVFNIKGLLARTTRRNKKE
jgi:hypothetical protein